MQSLKVSTSAGLALLASIAIAGSAIAGNYGTPVSEGDVAAWDIDISTPTGEGLAGRPGNCG